MASEKRSKWCKSQVVPERRREKRKKLLSSSGGKILDVNGVVPADVEGRERTRKICAARTGRRKKHTIETRRLGGILLPPESKREKGSRDRAPSSLLPRRGKRGGEKDLLSPNTGGSTSLSRREKDLFYTKRRGGNFGFKITAQEKDFLPGQEKGRVRDHRSPLPCPIERGGGAEPEI